MADADDAQRSYLVALAEALEPSVWNGEALQAAIFATAQERDLPSGRAFSAIYLAFLGRPSGPRAGLLWRWLWPTESAGGKR